MQSHLTNQEKIWVDAILDIQIARLSDVFEHTDQATIAVAPQGAPIHGPLTVLDQFADSTMQWSIDFDNASIIDTQLVQFRALIEYLHNEHLVFVHPTHLVNVEVRTGFSSTYEHMETARNVAAFFTSPSQTLNGLVLAREMYFPLPSLRAFKEAGYLTADQVEREAMRQTTVDAQKIAEEANSTAMEANKSAADANERTYWLAIAAIVVSALTLIGQFCLPTEITTSNPIPVKVQSAYPPYSDGNTFIGPPPIPKR